MIHNQECARGVGDRCGGYNIRLGSCAPGLSCRGPLNNLVSVGNFEEGICKGLLVYIRCIFKFNDDIYNLCIYCLLEDSMKAPTCGNPNSYNFSKAKKDIQNNLIRSLEGLYFSQQKVTVTSFILISNCIPPATEPPGGPVPYLP